MKDQETSRDLLKTPNKQSKILKMSQNDTMDF